MLVRVYKALPIFVSVIMMTLLGGYTPQAADAPSASGSTLRPASKTDVERTPERSTPPEAAAQIAAAQLHGEHRAASTNADYVETVIDMGFAPTEAEAISSWVQLPRGRWRTTTDSEDSENGVIEAPGCPDAPDGDFSRLLSPFFEVAAGDVVRVVVCTRSSLEEMPHRPACYIEYKVGEEWQRDGMRLQPATAWREHTYRSGAIPRGISQVRLRIGVDPHYPSDGYWQLDRVRVDVVSLRAYAKATRGQPRRPDVLLAVPDSLRADVLGAYGGERAHTPALNRLAAEGILFENATTACPWTKPSFASLFTGVYPSRHGADDAPFPLAESWQTLAETLREAGYFTAGFVYSNTDGFLGADMGYAQGFDVYVHRRDVNDLFDEITRFLDLNGTALASLHGGGVFLFYHLYEPHAPYENFAPDRVRNHGLLGTVDMNHQEHLYPLAKKRLKEGVDFNQDDFDYIRALYDLGVNLTDQRLEAVLERFAWAGLDEGLFVVFTSDHGESLGEVDDRWEHSQGWEPITRVPLVMRFPGRTPAGKRDADHRVSTLDVYSTLLAGLGLPETEGVDGLDLLDFEARAARDHAISEDRRHGWLTIRDGRYKLIARYTSKPVDEQMTYSNWALAPDSTTARYYLYDLQSDPSELIDLVAKKPEIADALKTRLLAYCRRQGILAGTDGAKLPAEALEVSDETQEMLKSMGYLGN